MKTKKPKKKAYQYDLVCCIDDLAYQSCRLYEGRENRLSYAKEDLYKALEERGLL